MYSTISFVKDTLMNTIDIITEKTIRKLKNSDEYVFRQLEEHLIRKNSRKCLIFSLVQLILGLAVFVFSITEKDAAPQGTFMKIIGSGVLMAASVLLFLYFKNELSVHKHEYLKLKVVFYIFWNLFTIGGFFISAGFYNSDGHVYIFLVFLSSVLAVPVFRLYENAIASAIYLIPCVYYGISEKLGAGFYIAVVCFILAFFWINSVKLDYHAKNWINKRKLKEATERCAGISQTDNLTGMLNRTGLSMKFKELYSNNHGEGKIAVIMADIDNFRYYNHKYGYDRSDGCLYNICNCIRIISKPVTDIVSRFGGDDFILVVENMDEIEVVKFAEQLRSSVETMALPFGDGIVTISIGISAISSLDDEDTYSKLLNEADLQLMVAKNSGKNCIGYRGRAFIQENGRKKENS